MISEWWAWLVSGRSGKSCSSDVKSMNLEWKTAACLYSQSTVTSQQPLVAISHWNSHLFYSANNLQVVKLSQNRNHFPVYSILPLP